MTERRVLTDGAKDYGNGVIGPSQQDKDLFNSSTGDIPSYSGLSDRILWGGAALTVPALIAACTPSQAESFQNLFNEANQGSGEVLGISTESVSSLFEKFHQKYLNQPVDFDKAFGTQCMDLVNEWSAVLGGKQFMGGWADEIWQQYPDFYKSIPNNGQNQPKVGDIFVWSNKHTGIYTGRKDPQGRLWVFEQNDPIGSVSHDQAYDLDSTNLIGWLRRSESNVTQETEEPSTPEEFIARDALDRWLGAWTNEQWAGGFPIINPGDDPLYDKYFHGQLVDPSWLDRNRQALIQGDTEIDEPLVIRWVISYQSENYVEIAIGESQFTKIKTMTQYSGSDGAWGIPYAEAIRLKIYWGTPSPDFPSLTDFGNVSDLNFSEPIDYSAYAFRPADFQIHYSEIDSGQLTADTYQIGGDNANIDSDGNVIGGSGRFYNRYWEARPIVFPSGLITSVLSSFYTPTMVDNCFVHGGMAGTDLKDQGACELIISQ